MLISNSLRYWSALVLVVVFSLTTIARPSYAQNALSLPAPGQMVGLTSQFSPIVLKGLKIYPENPLQFDFIIDAADENLSQEELTNASTKLIKYFMAALTVPGDEMWVNLSPYESDRIITQSFGMTDMGRDLLGQDYILKQLTASLIYPEKELGKKFWDRVYQQAKMRYGTTEIPVNTFNKVWIVPAEAEVYQNKDQVFITKTRLAVMLEEDYVALSHQKDSAKSSTPVGGVALSHQKDSAKSSTPVGDGDMAESQDDKDINKLGSAIIRELVIPEIEREINEGKNFAQLRQIYHSLILALWFKRNLKESLLGKVYVGQSKIEGIDIPDTKEKERIYQQYIEAYKKGVFNYIKEDYDETNHEIVPRKYFSGGLDVGDQAMMAVVSLKGQRSDVSFKRPVRARVGIKELPELPSTDSAMVASGTPKDREEQLAFIVGAMERNKHLIRQPFNVDTARKMLDEMTREDGDEMTLKLEPSIRSMVLEVLSRTIENASSEEINKLISFFNIFSLHLYFVEIGVPSVVIESNFKTIESHIWSFLGPEEIRKHALKVIEWDSLPMFELAPSFTMKELIDQLLNDDPSKVLRILSLIRQGEFNEEILFDILIALDASEFRFQLAEEILDKINEKKEEEIMDFNIDILLILIEALKKRVGRITNVRFLKKFYENNIEREYFPRKNFTIEMIRDLGGDKDDTEPESKMTDRQIWDRALENISDRIEDLQEIINYNPGRDVLAAVLDVWHTREIDGKIHLSDQEYNALKWVLNKIPKTGHSRDRRRQLHRFLYRWMENRRLKDLDKFPYQKADVFMGRVIGSIDTASKIVDPQSDLQKPKYKIQFQNVEPVLDFILDYSNLNRNVQEAVAEASLSLLDKWQEEAGGLRLFMQERHFVELRQFIQETVIENMLNHAVTLTPQEKEQLKQHIQQNLAAWHRDGFLTTLANYITFQEVEGVRYTEDLLRKLMKSEVVDGQFRNIPRYTWEDSEITSWFGEKLVNKIKKGAIVKLPIPTGEAVFENAYQGIYLDILGHIGIAPVNDLSQDIEHMQQVIDTKTAEWRSEDEEFNVRLTAEMLTLKSILEVVLTQLKTKKEKIDPVQVNDWRRQLALNIAIKPIWYQKDASWRELATNLTQITRIRERDTSDIELITFEVTDDPVKLLRSYSEPYETCQRCTEPTGQNTQGRPINRARQGQFFTALIIAHKNDGSTEILSRSLLEIAKLAESETPVERMLNDIFNRPSKRRSDKVLLSERVYDSGLFWPGFIEKNILDWARQSEGIIRFVAFANRRNLGLGTNKVTLLSLSLLSSDGEIYRDTFEENNLIEAIDFEATEDREDDDEDHDAEDEAMLSTSILSKTKDLGGIDLNPTRVDLKVTSDQAQLSASVFDVDKFISVRGFVPEIISITPVVNPAQLFDP